MHYIYKYTNKINGKVYIGQTNNLQKRFNGHKSEAFNPKSKGYNLPFHCAIRKYGIKNFIYEVLEEIEDGESQDFINDREIFFIDFYHSLTTENGYNLTVGGDGCPKSPLTYEEKLSRSKLFTGDEIKDIQQRLLNDEEFDDIEEIYKPKLKRTFLVNINTGTNFYNFKITILIGERKMQEVSFLRKKFELLKIELKVEKNILLFKKTLILKARDFYL